MLPKQNRLRTNKDFQKVFKSSKPIYTENLIFRVAKNESKKHKAESIKSKSRNNRTIEQSNPSAALGVGNQSRFGFVVSNKIDKRASRRNALRRRLRAVVQELMPQIKSGNDVAILVKKDFPLPYSYEEIKKQVEEGLRKAGLLK